uniref:Uncharacterized protein n=1 Tax=Anopheles atroparvus TaxID=41427 RepID=A0A182JI94_ANOAO
MALRLLVHQHYRFFHLAELAEVLPLVLIMTVAVVGCSSFMIYCGRTRTDVSLNKKVFEHDTMDVMNPKQRKQGPPQTKASEVGPLQMLVFNQKYGAMPELNEALSYREEYDKLAENGKEQAQAVQVSVIQRLAVREFY